MATTLWRIKEFLANGQWRWVQDGFDAEAWPLEYDTKADAEADVKLLEREARLGQKLLTYAVEPYTRPW